MTEEKELTGAAKLCDSGCPICKAARGEAKCLRLVVKAEYYTLGSLMKLLHVPWPCVSREKQTGKKPWE